MKKHLDTRLWDFILCVFISIGLSLNVFAGYDMTNPLADNILAVSGIVFAVTALLFISADNKKNLLAAIFITVTGVVAGILALHNSSAFNDMKTIDANPLLFWIIVIGTSLTVFWTSRSRAGLILLFLAGSITVAAFAFLEFPVSLVGYIDFIFSVFVMFMYRAYCVSLLHTDMGKIDFRAYFIQSTVVSTLAVALAAGLFFGVIKPLSPPTNEINLATRLMSLEVLEKIGVSTKTEIPSDNLTSNTLNNTNKTTQDNQNNKEQTKPQKKESTVQFSSVQGSNMQKAMAIIYEKKSYWLPILAVGIILIFAAAIISKLYFRKKWYRDLQKEANEDGVIKLYLRFLVQIRKAGLKRPEDLTLLEYAANSQKKLEVFSAGEADFLRLTQIYISVIYGYKKVSVEEYRLFQEFYKEFYKNMRREMGTFRYCLHLFAI